jgi:uncharacterized protein YjbI with pentapeptide repeats
MPAVEYWILLDNDVECWNRWRKEDPERYPDLEGVSLSRKHLAHVDLNRCNLTGSHLNHTDLSHSDLERANLSNASLTGADLTGAHMLRVAACGTNFAGAIFDDANLIQADLTNTHLADASFESANLAGSDISRASLFHANLRRTKLNNAKLSWSNLTGVNMSYADLSNSDLTGVSFIDANLAGADLSGANLRFARFIDSTLDGANLSGCRVYGTSVWNISSREAIQSDLIISRPDEMLISVDNLAVAQFIYLLLDSKDIRNAIDTISSKAVLILGRFTPERLEVLNGLRECLRVRGYLPLLFDFEGPSTRDRTETVSVLAHLARFILGDITEARSVAQELGVLVPNLPSVPVQPLLLRSEEPYGMFEHLQRYPWVLPVYEYADKDELLSHLDESVIGPLERTLQFTRKQ